MWVGELLVLESYSANTSWELAVCIWLLVAGALPGVAVQASVDGYERWYGGIMDGKMCSERDDGEEALGYSLIVACVIKWVVGGDVLRRRKCRKNSSFTESVEADSKDLICLSVWVLSLWSRALRDIDAKWWTFYPILYSRKPVVRDGLFFKSARVQIRERQSQSLQWKAENRNQNMGYVSISYFV